MTYEGVTDAVEGVDLDSSHAPNDFQLKFCQERFSLEAFRWFVLVGSGMSLFTHQKTSYPTYSGPLRYPISTTEPTCFHSFFFHSNVCGMYRYLTAQQRDEQHRIVVRRMLADFAVSREIRDEHRQQLQEGVDVFDVMRDIVLHNGVCPEMANAHEGFVTVVVSCFQPEQGGIPARFGSRVVVAHWGSVFGLLNKPLSFTWCEDCGAVSAEIGVDGPIADVTRLDIEPGDIRSIFLSNIITETDNGQAWGLGMRRPFRLVAGLISVHGARKVSEVGCGCFNCQRRA